MTEDVATDAAVDRVGVFLRQRIGLRSEGTLRGRLRRAVVEEAGVHGDLLGEYAEGVCRGGQSLEHLVNRITVQESGFFRHPEHFDVLADAILPGLDRPVTIWSSACANGQEAYSLAMLLEEHAIPGTVIASDLSTAALDRTAQAWYSSREISGISPERCKLHLIRDGHGWRIGPRVRARVTSFEHNLVDALPAQVASCQVVFCRNVLIYLSAEHASAFLDRLADALAPGTYLFLGAAESMWHVSDRFQPVGLGGTFVYRRRGPGGRTPSMSMGPAVPTSKSARRSTVGLRPRAARGAVRRVEPAVDTDLAQTAALAETGKLALAKGDHAAAIVVFRKWSYLTPEDPMGAFHLGLALEAGGHLISAQRAFAVSRAVLMDAGSTRVEPALEGFAREELLKLLDSKQAPYR